MIKKIGFNLTIIMITASFTILQGMHLQNQKGAGAFVLELAMRNRDLFFDHADICSLALVNKNNEKILLNTAKERRKRLEALNPQGTISSLKGFPLTWNRYGSMCAAQARTSYMGNIHKLELYFFTYKNNLCSTMVSQDFDHYPQYEGEYASLCKQVRIDPEGGIYCHGFGKPNDEMLWGKDYHIIEYSCSKEQKSRSRRCAVRIKHHGKNYALSYLLPFPSLFKALLQAPIVAQDDECKFYDLSCAIIPDNFKEVGKNYYYTFDQYLPKKLKKAIVKRYEQQKQQ